MFVRGESRFCCACCALCNPHAKLAKSVPCRKYSVRKLAGSRRAAGPFRTARKALRDALRAVQLDVLDEEEPRLVELLQKMGVKDMPLKTIADKALRQTKDLTLIVQLVKEGLGDILKGHQVFPAHSQILLIPEECLLWDKELDFEVIPRRMCKTAGERFQGLEGKLLEIGCRWELDLRDVLDLARQAQDTQDQGFTFPAFCLASNFDLNQCFLMVSLMLVTLP